MPRLLVMLEIILHPFLQRFSNYCLCLWSYIWLEYYNASNVFKIFTSLEYHYVVCFLIFRLNVDILKSAFLTSWIYTLHLQPFSGHWIKKKKAPTYERGMIISIKEQEGKNCRSQKHVLAWVSKGKRFRERDRYKIQLVATSNCLPDAQSAAFSLKIGTFHLSLVCFCVVCLYCIVHH